MGLRHRHVLSPIWYVFILLLLFFFSTNWIIYITRLSVQMETKTMNGQTSMETASERQGRGRDSGVSKGLRHAAHISSPLVHFFFLSYFSKLSFFLKSILLQCWWMATTTNDHHHHHHQNKGRLETQTHLEFRYVNFFFFFLFYSLILHLGSHCYHNEADDDRKKAWDASDMSWAQVSLFFFCFFFYFTNDYYFT